MTPRQAINKVRAFVDGTSNVPEIYEALNALERLVTKDETLDPVPKTVPMPRPIAVHCTCGTVVPCAVWGHS